MADGLRCYSGNFPCYGNNRESDLIYLILNDELSEFSPKRPKNSEEKNSFPVLSLFRARNRENHDPASHS